MGIAQNIQETQYTQEQVFLFSSVSSIKQMFPSFSADGLQEALSDVGITWVSDFSSESSLVNARSIFATAGVNASAWVYELEAIPEINFAAALAFDRPQSNVYVFAEAVSGSYKSRAKQAGITELVEPSLLKVNISALISKLASADALVFKQRECNQILEEEPLQEFQSISIFDTYEEVDAAAGVDTDIYADSGASTNVGAYAALDIYEGFDADSCETVLLNANLHESGKAFLDNSTSEIKAAKCVDELFETKAKFHEAKYEFHEIKDEFYEPKTELYEIKDEFREPKTELYEKQTIENAAHKNFSIKHAFLLPVVSASGGSGKSSICAISALVSAQMGYKTLVVDADFQFGNMREFLCDATCIDRSAFYDTNTLASLIDTPSRLPFVVAAPKKLEMAESAQDAISDLLSAADDFFDVIIVNTQSFWTESHVFLLNNASKALFVLDQRCSSIEACSKAISFCSRCGIAPSTYLFVLNKCSRKSSLHASEVSLRLGGARVVELPDGSKDVDEYISSGAAKDLIEERNTFCVSIENVLSEILPEAGVLKTKNADGKSLQGLIARTLRRKVAACLC